MRFTKSRATKCCNCTNTNCTIHIYLVSFPLYSLKLCPRYPQSPSCAVSSDMQHRLTKLVHKLFTEKLQLHKLLLDSLQETFIQPHLAEALCTLAAWSPLKIDGAPPVASLCIPETVGWPRLRTERGKRNRKKKQLPQCSCW